MKEIDNLLMRVNETGSRLVSSYHIPSSSDMLYIWSNESVNPNTNIGTARLRICYLSFLISSSTSIK